MGLPRKNRFCRATPRKVYGVSKGSYKANLYIYKALCL